MHHLDAERPRPVADAAVNMIAANFSGDDLVYVADKIAALAKGA